MKQVRIIKQYFPQRNNQGYGRKSMRVLGGHEQEHIDPMLGLFYVDLKLPAGFPDHPHRGFETVTYVLEGSIYHEDFTGAKDVIGPGDCQWMTAGKGIMHAEMPGSDTNWTKCFQLWINLSMDKKMMDPMYQDCKSHEIQEYNRVDESYRQLQKVRVIAGETHGVKGRVIPNSESLFYDVHLAPDQEFRTDIPVGFQGMVFVYQGKNLSFGENGHTTLGFEQTTIFEANCCANKLVVKAKNSGGQARFLVIAGLPNNEPIKQHGPFVMNTEKELAATFEDYENYRNGFEARRGWRSQVRRMSQDVQFRPDFSDL